METESITKGAIPTRTVGWARNTTLFDLWVAAVEAEKVFEAAYKADPKRNGMRPGDFRYRGDLHSPETVVAGDAFSAAMNAWRIAYREATA